MKLPQIKVGTGYINICRYKISLERRMNGESAVGSTHRQFLIDALDLAAECVKIGDLGQQTLKACLHLVHAVQHGVKIIGFLCDATQTGLNRLQ